MSKNVLVRVGVEWVEDFPEDEVLCEQKNEGSDCKGCTTESCPDLEHQYEKAQGFFETMGKYGHTKVFNWGNDDVWAIDFEYPDSINYTDDVHFLYYADHGTVTPDANGGYYDIGFSRPIWTCFTSSRKWQLGAKYLKWAVFNTCELLKNTSADHIVNIWAEPMRGVHLIFGFTGEGCAGGDGAGFAEAICNGEALGNAWLEASDFFCIHDTPEEIEKYGSSRWSTPIVIAAGNSQEDAIARRDFETLDWRDMSVISTNWLAWKWYD